MKDTVRALVLAGLGLVLGGCATSPPSSFYTLTAMPGTPDPAETRTATFSVGLGPVSFPVFLDRPQIVRRNSGNRLAIDEFHRWGGTLQDDFLRVWTENLTALLGTTRVFPFPSEVQYPLDFRVTADVLAFEGSADAEAILRVRWTVLDHRSREPLRVEETRYRRPIGAPGDESALIAAMSATLGDFSRDVAATLHRLPMPEPAASEDRLPRP